MRERERDVPAGEARAHLRQLLKTHRQVDVAQLAGLTRRTLSRVLNPDTAWIYQSTADLILAIPAPSRRPPGGRRRRPADDCVPATAATRQLRAMAVVGIGVEAAARRATVGQTAIWRIREGHPALIEARTADLVDAAYGQACEDLYVQWPAPIVGDGSLTVRRLALGAGWHGPCAWSADTIGIRNAKPRTEGLTPVVCRDLLQAQIAYRRAGRVPRRAA